MPDAYRTWDDFNADFQFPATDDARRIAHEVKASVDRWISESVNDLQKQMTQEREQQKKELDKNIKDGSDALKQKKKDFDDLIAQLKTSDPNLQQAVTDLKTKAEEAQKAMQAAVDQWEKNGNQLGTTAAKIAETFTKVAA